MLTGTDNRALAPFFNKSWDVRLAVKHNSHFQRDIGRLLLAFFRCHLLAFHDLGYRETGKTASA